MPSERIVEMEKLIKRMEKRVTRLAVFVVVLFIVAFSLVVSTSQYLWDENRFLFLGVVISVPLAFLLKRKMNSMEREMNHLKTIEAGGYPKDYDKRHYFMKAMSTEALLEMREEYQENHRKVWEIDRILKERGEATKES